MHGGGGALPRHVEQLGVELWPSSVDTDARGVVRRRVVRPATAHLFEVGGDLETLELARLAPRRHPARARLHDERRPLHVLQVRAAPRERRRVDAAQRFGARLTVQKDEALQLLAQQAAQAAQTAGRDDAAALHREIAEQRDVIERQRVAYNAQVGEIVRELRAQQVGQAQLAQIGALHQQIERAVELASRVEAGGPASAVAHPVGESGKSCVIS